MLRDTHNVATREEFLREARLMVTFNHHCIVKLIGFSEGPPLLMVQELVSLGSMLAYLLEFPDRISHNYELKIWASQIACGKLTFSYFLTIKINLFSILFIFYRYEVFRRN